MVAWTKIPPHTSRTPSLPTYIQTTSTAKGIESFDGRLCCWSIKVCGKMYFFRGRWTDGTFACFAFWYIFYEEWMRIPDATNEELGTGNVYDFYRDIVEYLDF
jgi:hypothetical protein